MQDLLERLAVIDVDAHEMAPSHMWGTMFGPHSARFAEVATDFIRSFGANSFWRPGLVDDASITADSVWNAKGPAAPGAFDFDRRRKVLDTMGIARQLIFPSAALLAFGPLTGSSLASLGLPIPAGEEGQRMLRGVVAEYNDWVVRTTAAPGGRFRPAALLAATSIDELLEQARDLVTRGARAVWLPTSHPPGGFSPAAPELDPFWALMAAGNVAVTLHLGTDSGFRSTDAWSQAPAFAVGKVDSVEIALEPFGTTTVHMGASNFLTAMVLGGVFERHPALRFGIIELGATWFGPLAEHLDLWVEHIYAKRMAKILSMPPSAYMDRNVRVTPFYFEPVDLYFRRYPQLSHCWCYSSDYPHVEGGIDSKLGFLARLAPLGEEAVEKFFVGNGAWLVLR
ncbi:MULTISPECIES: amidohydrolase family protein [unclassified Sphingomonas]|uniref:amidohydrolase family protein n=1 Tax=unclassified Sphingomonas TaxID=196159 RepID=UPI0006F91929|nr:MULTISPECIES: amidohydrolase family protein [unclassified Sphingomonas]KQX17643.1 amidohydrolase [Sphingomonas sp. Root1294]KQY70569.1 amidohydrolase [Sphingomonas sp. Root50]KRB91942.1 amidohydrolase [Sphingomonas sp. Root720]